MRTALLVLLLLGTLPALPQAADPSERDGTITGTVLDHEGRPIKGVQVCSYRRMAASGSAESRGSCQARTDSSGQFRIENLGMGEITLEAIKPEDGYVAFAGTSVTEVVNLSSSQPSATVSLKLGPRVGQLIPTVKDKNTGQPIPEALIGWHCFDERGNGSASGGQRITRWEKSATIPPERWLVITVSAKGYKTWLYHDPSDLSRPAFFRLQPGEVRDLSVELEPDSTAQQ